MSLLFLGVDGGQTSTTALIGNAEGETIGWATAGPCDHVSAAEAQVRFTSVMRDCIGRAAASAHVERPHFHSACFGLSGGTEDKSELVRKLITADHLLITDDTRIALAGATGGTPGIVVISGTGSVAFGENARGETARAGGWGYIFGDEGSGFDIARQALRAVLREAEGWGARTALTPALLEATGASNAGVMLHLFYTPEWPRSRVASLAPIVDRTADESDPIALGIVERAAQDLATLAVTVRRIVFSEFETALVSWTGGVFASRTVRERFQTILSLSEGCRCEPPAHGPATGALLLARRIALRQT